MIQPQEPVETSPDTPAVPEFDADELQRLAKFFDALMEVDFEQQRNERVGTNGNSLQAA